MKLAIIEHDFRTTRVQAAGGTIKWIASKVLRNFGFLGKVGNEGHWWEQVVM